MRPEQTRALSATREPDAATLAGCREGDAAALGRVFESQSPALERLLFRVLGPDEAVEDVMQATFEAAIVAFPRFRGEASVKTWLSRIAVRLAQEHFRKRNRRRRIGLSLLAEEPEASEADAEAELQHRVHLRRVYEHLDQIDVKKRTALLLHVVEGHSIAEVAALMGASETATKSRIFWARRSLLARAARDPLLRESLELAKNQS
jgi:RNA polymerase sigma-70 factor (ECF subfamily)